MRNQMTGETLRGSKVEPATRRLSEHGGRRRSPELLRGGAGCFSSRFGLGQGVFATIGWAEFGKWQVPKYPVTVEIEDAKVAPLLEGFLDDVKLLAVLVAHV